MKYELILYSIEADRRTLRNRVQSNDWGDGDEWGVYDDYDEAMKKAQNAVEDESYIPGAHGVERITRVEMIETLSGVRVNNLYFDGQLSED